MSSTRVPEAASEPRREQFLTAQTTDISRLAACAEQGELVTHDCIAIGVSQQVVKQPLNADLPSRSAAWQEGVRAAAVFDSEMPGWARGNRTRYGGTAARRAKRTGPSVGAVIVDGPGS